MVSILLHTYAIRITAKGLEDQLGNAYDTDRGGSMVSVPDRDQMVAVNKLLHRQSIQCPTQALEYTAVGYAVTAAGAVWDQRSTCGGHGRSVSFA